MLPELNSDYTCVNCNTSIIMQKLQNRRKQFQSGAPTEWSSARKERIKLILSEGLAYVCRLKIRVQTSVLQKAITLVEKQVSKITAPFRYTVLQVSFF